MKSTKAYVAALLVSFMLSFGMLAVPHASFALFESAKDQACNGVNAQDGVGCGAPGSNSGKVNSVLKTTIELLSFIVGIISVIMIIIGGIKYSTSQGDGISTAAARNTIIYAIVGLVVVALAQGIVFFVLGKTT